MSIKRDYFLMGMVLFLVTWVLGCNMIKGAGKDVENAGEGIQKTVNHND